MSLLAKHDKSSYYLYCDVSTLQARRFSAGGPNPPLQRLLKARLELFLPYTTSALQVLGFSCILESGPVMLDYRKVDNCQAKYLN